MANPENFDLNELMKQAKAMQQSVEKAQAQIVDTTVIGESPDGLIKIKMAGNHDVKGVRIAKSLLENIDDEDGEGEGGEGEGGDGENSIANRKEMIQDLIAAAFNAGNRKLEGISKKKLDSISKKLNLPIDKD